MTTTTAASNLRDLVIEAATCLICANGNSCSHPDSCRRDAARYIEQANELLDGQEVTVKTVRIPESVAFAVTETGHIRVRLPDGGTDIIEGIEVIPW